MHCLGTAFISLQNGHSNEIYLVFVFNRMNLGIIFLGLSIFMIIFHYTLFPGKITIFWQDFVVVLLNYFCMSSWQYKFCQSKPMALPFAPIDTDAPGYQEIDHFMTEDTASEEREHVPSYLGSGGWGVAVEFPNGHVGKYTSDRNEAQFAQSLIETPLPCFVQIFTVRQVQRSSKSIRDLWIIEMEKVKELSKRSKRIYSASQMRWSIYPQRSGIIDRDTFVQSCIDDSDNPEKDGYISGALWDLFTCLLEYNVIVRDPHSDNVGWNSDNRLVVFDLGLASYASSHSCVNKVSFQVYFG